MNPNDIKIDDFNKAFEYEKLSRDIDSISEIEDLRTLAKCYIKLYLKQQEVVSQLASL